VTPSRLIRPETVCRSDGVAASSHRAYDADGHPDAEAVATLVPLCPMSSVVRGVTA